jgi:carbon monoxide dehydrogenase subunit G
MLRIESKTGTVNGNQQKVYEFLADFRNFGYLLPADRLRNLEIAVDTIRFGIDGLGNVGLRFSERNPFSRLVIKATEDSSANFTFWISIMPAADNQSQVNLVLEASLNMFLEMMARGPLQQFTDLIIDKLIAMEFVK